MGFLDRRTLLLCMVLMVVLMVITWMGSGFYSRIADSVMGPRISYDVIRSARFYNHPIKCGTPDKITAWTPPALPERLHDAEQHSTDLVKHICDNWIIPPFTVPRQLDSPSKVDYSQSGQSPYIDNVLQQRENGFYIECGAASGEGLSNSLFFEKERHWNGILIEANPLSFKGVLHTRRHAYMMNACLSPKTTPALLDFTLANYIGGLSDLIEDSHKKRIEKELQNNTKTTKIQCFPLVSILKAINITHVDYFSLDIEGAEMDILRTFPFHEITVDVITIEYAVSSNWPATKQKLADIKHLLVDKYGYIVTPFKSSEDILLVRGV